MRLKDDFDHVLDIDPSKPGEETTTMVDNAPTDLLGRKRVVGLRNADSAVGSNPKDRIGAAKVDFSLLPASAKVAWALAQMDGAGKYGPYNWRVEAIQLRTYIAAADRHLSCFLDGEEVASDSLIKHLGHVMACCGIMIDAMQNNSYVDDRPINGNASEVIAEANKFIKEQKPEGWGR